MTDTPTPTPEQPPQEAQPDLTPEQEAALRAREFHLVTAGRMDAQITHHYLMERMEAFENGLDEHHELGVRLANSGLAQTIHIRAISYRNPNLIEFRGQLDGGEVVDLVQHISQLNLLLVSVPPVQQEKVYRVGFGAHRKTLPPIPDEGLPKDVPG